MVGLPNDVEPTLVGQFRTSSDERRLPPSGLANHIEEGLSNANESLDASTAQINSWNTRDRMNAPLTIRWIG